MKKSVLLLLFIIGITTYNNTDNKGIIFYYNGSTYNITNKLPSDCIIDGEHVNFGVKDNQFGLFWLPFWNYGTPEYALISDNGKLNWSLNKEEIDFIKSDYHISTTDEPSPSPSFWNKIRIKRLIIFVIIYIIWLIFKSKSKGEDTDKDPYGNHQTKV